MRYNTILILLISLISCKDQEKKINSTDLNDNHDEILHKNKFSHLKYPFGQAMSEFKKDSLNSYGAGDCWGDVIQYSGIKFQIGIDSTACGEYGFDYSFYLLQNNGIKIAYLKESQTLIGKEIVDTKYALTEKIYDFRQRPHEFYMRSDTLKTDKFESINSDFQQIKMDDFQTTYEHLKIGYENAWKMIEDY